MDVYHPDRVQQRGARHFMSARGLRNSTDDALLPESHCATAIETAHQLLLKSSP